MATPRKMGQPPKFSSVEALEKKVNEYFDSPDAYMDTPEGPVFAPTMSGLALYLDMDRRSLTNYANRDEFFPTIKKARARVEQHLERKLYGGQVAGVIFNLKNNFGWMDKLEDSSSKDSETVNKIQIEVVNAHDKD